MLHDCYFNEIFYKLCRVRLELPNNSYLQNYFSYDKAYNDSSLSVLTSGTLKLKIRDGLGIVGLESTNFSSFSYLNKTSCSIAVRNKKEETIIWPSEKDEHIQLTLIEYIFLFGRGTLVQITSDERLILDGLFE